MSEFIRFGAGHLIAIFSIAVVAIVCAIAARRAPSSAPVRYLLAFLLAAATVGYLAGEARERTLGVWDFAPLHLCDAAIFLAIFALVTARQRAAELLYFVSLGTLFAIVTPDVIRGFGQWQTVSFFVLHGLVIVAAVTLTFGMKLYPQGGGPLRAFAALNVYALAVAVVNWRFGTNFLYLARKPSQPSPLDWFGPWPVYIIVAEAFALVLFAVAAFPFALRGDAKSKSVRGGKSAARKAMEQISGKSTIAG
jgi:hypothetical integral membrane protein (TIGR02206 family)